MDQIGRREGGAPPLGSSGAVPSRAASEGELNDASSSRRLLAFFDQRRVFPHHGTSALEQEASSTTTGELSNGGARGSLASHGMFGSVGTPGVVGLAREQPVYPFARFHWFLGTNRNPKWYPKLASWCAASWCAAGTPGARE